MLTAAALASALLLDAAEAKTRALVIGIDDYAHVPTLAGAVNDARDLSDALRTAGAEVVLLLDAEATRARILDEWAAIARAAQPGDSIVLTYAGHGVQMPEALPGDERDGMDEVFILRGFQTSGSGLAERIRDNDVAEMLAHVPPDVAVLVVADSCHSGTMTRTLDPRGSPGRSRWVPVGPVTGPDPLSPPLAATRALDPSDFPNVVFAHAAGDEEQTPEVEIDGSYRGALSWSVARAIETRGRRDPGDPFGDFRDYVVEQVRALSGSRQTPGVLIPRAINEKPARQGFASLLRGDAATPVAASEADLSPAPAPRLFIRGEPEPDMPTAAEIVEIEESARLLWDRGRGELVDRATADVIAEAVDSVGVDEAVEKWRAVQPLLRWAPHRPLELRVEPDDRRYRVGDSIWITAARPGPDFRHLTIVNLASTGDVQFIFPSAAHVADELDVFPPNESVRRLGPAPVSLPVGADHVIALASRERLDRLHVELARLDGRRAPAELLRLLEEHAGAPESVRVGVLPIFTAR